MTSNADLSISINVPWREWRVIIRRYSSWKIKNWCRVVLFISMSPTLLLYRKRTTRTFRGNVTLAVEVLFRYIRRKAEHFRVYQEKTPSTSFNVSDLFFVDRSRNRCSFQSFNITISVEFVGPKEIFVNVSIKQQMIIWEGIACLVYLTSAKNTRSKVNR